jgi:hypothetical protein
MEKQNQLLKEKYKWLKAQADEASGYLEIDKAAMLTTFNKLNTIDADLYNQLGNLGINSETLIDPITGNIVNYRALMEAL